MAKGSKNKTIKREVVPPKCLQDNNMNLDSDTDIYSDHKSEMSQSLFKQTSTKVVKKKAAMINKNQRTRADKVPICIIKTNKHHRIERHNIPDEDTKDTEEPENDAQITSDIEPVHPIYTIRNNMANPPPPGSGEDSDPLAALGLTPRKTHKAQRSPAKSPRSTTGK